jgi:hypothetical protein
MILISHRGNINGRMESLENKPTQIDMTIKQGYDVEIDIWYKDGILWLGHDKPDYDIDLIFLTDRITKLWVHCKNIEAVVYFTEIFQEYPFNFFWHQEDDITLTSLNHIWAYPGKQPIKGSIAVMPELFNDNTTKCLGICSDYISNYLKQI